MWLTVEYQPVSLFSLKPGFATSSGAKTLLVPSPFAIRTALVDAAIRTQGLAEGAAVFTAVKPLEIAIRYPKMVAVTNLFVKILKPARADKGRGEGGANDDEGSEEGKGMTPTIGYREYASLHGALGIAFGGDTTALERLQPLLPQINSFGKRGSFFQSSTEPGLTENLPDGFQRVRDASFSILEPVVPGQSFPLGIIQVLDDWGESLTFQKLNTYTDEKIVLGKDRIRLNCIVPYRLIRASRSFSLYQLVHTL